MLVYAGIFLTLLIKIYYQSDNKEDSKIQDEVIFVIISFILGFNYLMGADWQSYQQHYNTINTANYQTHMFDFGYNLYVYFIKKISGFSYEMFIGLTITSCIYILIKNIKKKTKNYYLAILVYLIIYLLGASLEPVIRQLIGITIIVSGLGYIEKKSFLKYLVIVLIASQFHSSLYIALIFYFLDKIEISLFKFMILTILVFILVENIERILTIRNSLTEILRVEKFANYILLMKNTERNLTSGIIFHFILMSGYIYILFNSYKKDYRKKNYILNGALLYCLISMFSYKFAILFRILEIFSIFFVIAISHMNKIIFFGGFKLTERTGKLLLILFALFQITRHYRMLLTNKPNNFRYGTYRNYIIEKMKPGFYESKEEKEKIYIKKINYLINEERIEKKII